MHSPALSTGRITRIERGATHDGPGLRTVVFLKGCPLQCVWCHGPETQSLEPEVLLYPERCIACGGCVEHCPEHAAGWEHEAPTLDRSLCMACGTCLDVCPTSAREVTGELMTVDEVLAEVLRDRIFYDASGGGITISGGEPMLQPHFVMALLERCRREAIHSAVETCGLGNRAILERVAGLTDLILFDIKLFDESRHRAATGHGNSGILSNIRLLSRLPAEVRVRIPLVPGLNDDDANIAAIGAFVRDAGLTQVDVLPYHRAGMAKYERLGRAYPIPDTPAPSSEAVAATVSRLRQFGLDVTPGGVA